MKLVKMSLVAALLVGSSAFAIENTEISGSASIFYGTDDSGEGLFNKDTAIGQAGLSLGMSTDLSDTVKANTNLTVLSTLGLEGQLVNGVWEGTNGVSDSYWFDTANVSANLGNTNATIGRMALDTPLVFTETWSIASNTFEAAVVANTDIPDTTIVGAYVGGSNGAVDNASGGMVVGAFNANGTTNFSQFYNGAYTVGIVNNSFKPLTAQAWYYEATSVGTAYWLQADLVCEKVKGLIAGIQYTGQELDGVGADATSAMAVMAGYSTDALTAKVSYSMVDDAANAGANLSGSGMSKLYTESWWTWLVSTADTTAMNLTVEAPVAGYDLGLYATMASNDTTNNDPMEVTVTAARSAGDLDVAVAYIMTDMDVAGTDAVNSLQAFLTYNF